MVNKLFHELSNESQTRVMEVFYEYAQHRKNKPRVTPEQFIEKYTQYFDTFPHCTPLTVALRYNSGSSVKILLKNGAQAGHWNPTIKCSALDQSVVYFNQRAKLQLDNQAIPTTTNTELLLEYHAIATSPTVLARFEELRLSHPNAFKAVNDLLNKSVNTKDRQLVYNHQAYFRVNDHQVKIKERFEITKDIFFKSLKQANK